MALTKISEFFRPTSLEEAFSLLKEKDAQLVGGGIDVILFPSGATSLIDLTALPLSGIEKREGEISIGATTTMTQLLESPIITGYLGGVVGKVLHNVASPLQRNLATIGGSLMIAHPWSDLITGFLVLEARISYFDGEEHEVPIARFYEENLHRKKIILTAITLPEFPPQTAAAFVKFSRTGFDIALLNCAARVQIVDGLCVKAKLALGGTPRRAEILPQAGEALTGKPLTAETIAQAARTARDEAEVGADMRASADYRRELVEVGVRRVLSEISGRLGGGM